MFFHFNNRLTINFLLAFLNLGTTGGARNKIIEILDNPFHIPNIQKANRILKLKSDSLRWQEKYVVYYISIRISLPLIG